MTLYDWTPVNTQILLVQVQSHVQECAQDSLHNLFYILTFRVFLIQKDRIIRKNLNNDRDIHVGFEVVLWVFMFPIAYRDYLRLALLDI